MLLKKTGNLGSLKGSALKDEERTYSFIDNENKMEPHFWFLCVTSGIKYLGDDTVTLKKDPVSGRCFPFRSGWT